MNHEHPLQDIAMNDLTQCKEEDFGQAVRRGMQKAVRVKRQRKTLTASLCSAVVIATFILGLNNSPAFAMAIGHIPGLRNIAQLVTFDKGLKMALENEYYQPVGQAQEKGGITVNIDGIMADDGAMTIFWDASGNVEGISMFPRVTLKDNAGNTLPCGVSSTSAEADDGTRIIQIDLPIPPLPDDVIVELSIYNQSRSSEPVQAGEEPAEPTEQLVNTFTFPIAIDRSIRKPGIEYPINKNLLLTPGAAITVEKLVVYPTHARLLYHETTGNTETVKYLSLRLINERGETFQAITGISGTMESTFFSRSTHLTLEIDKASTLPKGAQKADIDPGTGAVFGPAARWLVPLSVTSNNGVIRLTYTIPEQYLLDRTSLYDPFLNIITDDAGNPVASPGTECHFENDKPIYILLIKDQPISGHIHVELGISPPVAVQGGKIEIK